MAVIIVSTAIVRDRYMRAVPALKFQLWAIHLRRISTQTIDRGGRRW